VISSRWLICSQTVGRKCSTWRPSLIHPSRGESGTRLRWPPLAPLLTPLPASSPAGGADPPSSRCSGG
jgi:hypothetical protein